MCADASLGAFDIPYHTIFELTFLKSFKCIFPSLAQQRGVFFLPAAVIDTALFALK